MRSIPASAAWRRSVVLAVCFAGFVVALPGFGSPPSNDTCDGAIVVANSFPYLTPLVDVSEATTAGDPPLPPASTFFDTNVSRSVWYVFRPAVSGLYTLSVGYDTATTISDTSMAVYTSGGGGCAGATNLFGYNEDSGLLRSALTTNLAAATDYYIVVWVGSVETATNGLMLQLRVSKPTVPANDNCAGAEVVTSLPYLSAVTDTLLASNESGLSPTCASPDPGRVPSRSLWYKFTPATSGTYIFSTKADETQTSVEDTLISVYTSPSGCSGPFAEVSGACNDNGVGRAVFAKALTVGTVYYVVVWDNSPQAIAGETLVQLRVSPATQPTVTTLPPLSISSTGAALQGTVNANGLQSRFWFEWGPTTGLGSTSQVKLIFANSTTTYLTNLMVSGFLPNTPYHYRFAASNMLNTVWGDDYTFVWSTTSPRLTNATDSGGGTFSLEFEGNPSQLYEVESSTNLLNWEALGLATNATNVSPTHFLYRHSQGGFDPNRFYRVTLP